MHAAPPEIGILQILLGLVAEPVPNVLADEGRPEVAGRLEAVDHRRCRDKQMHQTVLRRHQRLAELLAGRDVAPSPDDLERLAGRVAQQRNSSLTQQ